MIVGNIEEGVRNGCIRVKRAGVKESHIDTHEWYMPKLIKVSVGWGRNFEQRVGFWSGLALALVELCNRMGGITLIDQAHTVFPY